MTESPGAGLISSGNSLVPWRLSWVGIVLCILYVSIVLATSLPLRLLEPSWQLRVIGALVNGSGFPLVGLGLLHLASYLAPQSQRLARRRRFCAGLAVPVALGFLLLIPLQFWLSWQTYSTRVSLQQVRLGREQSSISAIRQAITGSSSHAELQKKLEDLNGAKLAPAELAMPLPLLKAQAAVSLDQAELRLRRRRDALPSGDAWGLLGPGLSNALSTLAVAIGFAALAQPSGSGGSLLHSWQAMFSWMPFLQRRTRQTRESERVAGWVEDMARHDDRS